MIFYFSGTGNSKWAALRLARATGETARFIPTAMKDQCAYTLKTAERIGFVFPVHGWRPPLIVRRFVRGLKLDAADLRSHYCYALCTAGDDIGLTMDCLNEDLACVGLQIDAAFSLKMPNSYVGLPFMDTDGKAAEAEKLRQAALQLQDYAERIVRREKGASPVHLSHWPRTNSRFLGAVFAKWLVTDKPFRVDEARCVKCGICANVCPVGNVEGGYRLRPRWKHDGSCVSCFACYHHCPHHAIEYGWATRRKGQYFLR
ncbi:EFR1 family ferrodoxin [Segatella maculosa]|uniref:EFR1 family ferrodoxin n=1 Tax=Segatella maculosa TaxID=439703 RepID=UPI0028D14FB2|nr:EFR1 family ferrodoxin [Segatella maculosa]